MINQPELEPLRSLARLSGNKDFNTVNKWLKSELERISSSNDELLDEVSLRRGQGAALLLRQLLSIQSSAETTLNKLK